MQILCSAARWFGMWNQLDGTKPMDVPSEQACFNESDELLRCWYHHHLWGRRGVVRMLRHLSAERLSPLLQQHKVGEKSPKNPSQEIKAVHHSLFPCPSNRIIIPGN